MTCLLNEIAVRGNVCVLNDTVGSVGDVDSEDDVVGGGVENSKVGLGDGGGAGGEGGTRVWL